MARNKRNREEKKGAAEKTANVKSRIGKGTRNATATAAICAAAFGAYYSPDFRAASSDWFDRLRDVATAKRRANATTSGEAASVPRPLEAPSFRDFLTAEYGEDGARELLRSSETVDATSNFADYVAAEDSSASLPSAPSSSFADYVAAEDSAVPSLPSAPASSFADYAAAEDSAVPSLPSAPSSSFANYAAAEDSSAPAPSFADYAAAEDSSSSLPSAPAPSFADYVAAESSGNAPNENESQHAETAALAEEDETALTARLRNEMASRGVDAPRIERWGERFWRASGYAATQEGVATHCEAVDVDPSAAQRTALEKFDAVKR